MSDDDGIWISRKDHEHEVTALRTQLDEAVRLLTLIRLGLVAIHVGAKAGIATPSASLALGVESIARSAIRSIDDFTAAALNKEGQ